MTPPARLTTPEAMKLIATMKAGIAAVQAAAGGDRYVQIRRGNVADRVAAGLSSSPADAYDWWVDEEKGARTEWVASVVIPTTADEEADGVARTWRYDVRYDGEIHESGWYPVELPTPEGV